MGENKGGGMHWFWSRGKGFLKLLVDYTVFYFVRGSRLHVTTVPENAGGKLFTRRSDGREEQIGQVKAGGRQ